MKIKLFFLFALFLISANASAKYCKANHDKVSVSLGEVYIQPGIAIGSIIAESTFVETKVTCSKFTEALVAYTDVRQFVTTGVTVKLHTPNYYGEDCEVVESGYPGLGIAWMNYNSNTDKWICVSDSIRYKYLTRGMRSNETAIIRDQIYLVKTGPISEGDFSYTNPFEFKEGNPDLSHDYGSLYKVTLEGSAKIIAPVCTATGAGDTYTYTYKFTIDNAIKLEYQSPDEIINITCSGNMKDGTISFNPISLHGNGKFTQNNNYFATSDESVGVEVSYKVKGDTTEKVVKPSEQISVPITNSKGQIFLKYKPYIVKDSEKYPLTDKIDFNLSLKSE